MLRLLLPLFVISMLSACGSSSSGTNPDVDGDGVVNELDAFPQDARESVDTDGDGVGDNSDAFPEDASETLDSDLDGVGDTADEFPNDNSESIDSDGDGVGDNGDIYPLDFDNDTVPDDIDLFPQDPTESTDEDGDGIGDNSDPVFDVNYENIGLGNGVGSSYQDGVAKTGLFEGETLSATGSTTISVSVVDKSNENNRYPRVVNVHFTSTCHQVGLAEFTPSEMLASGIAATTYKDKGCGRAHGATDNIVVLIVSEDDEGNLTSHATATTTVFVLPKEVGAIEFVEAVPSIIALSGQGTAEVPSISRLEFQVLDFNGNPIPDHIVDFELDHDFSGADLSVVHATSDLDGRVQTTLSAGNVTGSVRVKASVDIRDEGGRLVTTVTTLSTPITIATSLASQQGFSISANVLNPHAWDKEDSEVVITAFAADSNLNPVTDGTRIYFKESAGYINSSCETVAGECSVIWQSANPKSVDGYVTILAHTSGQGNFQDSNSNGLFDYGESYQTFGETWLDANGNGVYDASGSYQPDLDIDNDGSNDFTWNSEGYLVYVNLEGEYAEHGDFYENFVDANSNSQFDPTPSNKYQGLNCSAWAISEGHCSQLLDVTASLRLQMSAGNDAYIEGPFLMAENGEYDFSHSVNCVDAQEGGRQVAWRVADSKERRNHLPAGSTINYTNSNVTVTSENGFGEVPSLVPPLVLPVWEVQEQNRDLTGAERKYKYLNERAHLVEVLLSKPEDVDPALTHGILILNVGQMNGSIYLGLIQSLSIGYSSDYCAPPVLELEL